MNSASRSNTEKNEEMEAEKEEGWAASERLVSKQHIGILFCPVPEIISKRSS